MAPWGEQAEGADRPLAESPRPQHGTSPVVRSRPRQVAAVSQAVLGRTKDQGDVLTLLKYVTKEKSVTFVYAASDEERNSAVALKELLERGTK